MQTDPSFRDQALDHDDVALLDDELISMMAIIVSMMMKRCS
ncbi:Hypothetical protein A7982_08866 [Minicystis rosea]|nr:Hypothetical protein A7982_08866 [Minicystis rosea]